MTLVVTIKEGEPVELRGTARVVKARNGRVTLKMESEKEPETSLTDAEADDYTNGRKPDDCPNKTASRPAGRLSY